MSENIMSAADYAALCNNSCRSNNMWDNPFMYLIWLAMFGGGNGFGFGNNGAAQMASCCCDIKSNILNQTNALQNQISTLANGVQTGFANLGFLTQQQTNELNTNNSANTQRIIDQLNAQTTNDLRDKLFDMSQAAQTASIVSQLKTT